jgi:hypothetical protein
MKKYLPSLIAMLSVIFVTNIAFSQTVPPQAISYQALIRNSNGNAYGNKDVLVKVSVLEASISGSTIYSEEHSIITDKWGMVSLEIGNGTPISGTFGDINWGTNNFFCKMEVDLLNGQGYELVGITQFISVPYALFSGSAGTVESIDYSQVTNTPDFTNWDTDVTDDFSGYYDDLSNLPNLFDGDYNSLTNLPTLFSGNYNDLTNLPTLFDGNWNSLIGTPPNISLFNNNLGYLTSYTEIQSLADVIALGNSANNFKIVNLAYPTSANDAATKSYVDDLDTLFHSLRIVNEDFSYSTLLKSNGIIISRGEFYPGYVINNDSTGYIRIGVGEFGNPSYGFTGLNIHNEGYVNKFGFNTYTAKSTIHVGDGDVYIEDFESGVILKSPNGSCWRVTIDDGGNLIRTSIACP